MANDLNKVIIIGRLTRDPELSYIPSGTAVAKFSIACNRSYTINNEKKEETSFFNCIAWTKLGELVAQYSKKGNKICVDGRLQQRSWEDQNGNKKSAVEIIAENVQFLSPKDSSGSDIQIDIPDQNYSMSKPFETDNNPFSDDDIPF
jgi:single-strand DNA-binding protein